MPIRIELDKIHLKPRGKNSHTWYQVSYFCKALVPESRLLGRRRALLAGWETRADADLIRERVDYYCRVDQPFGLGEGARTVESMRWRRGNYNHDLYEVLRYFPHDWRFNAVFGDNLNFPRRMTLRQDATKKSSIFTRFHLQSPRFFVKIESNSYSQ